MQGIPCADGPFLFKLVTFLSERLPIINQLVSRRLACLGRFRAETLAIRDAEIAKTDIDHGNAHATSTMADAVETLALKRVLGEHAYKIPVAAIKSMTGHSGGAAGGVEAVACALTIHRGVIPPTINLEHPDPACDLDYVPNRAREASVNVILKNSFGFGGVNACLVYRRLP